MIIIYGTQLYGKVDRIPGLCYVVTRFSHLSYFPLFPEETYLILDLPGDKGNRGKSIPMSAKSMLFGWLRGACVISLIVSAVVGLFGFLDTNPKGEGGDTLLGAGLWFVMTGAVLGLTYLFNKASPRRAAELGQYLGISEEAMHDLLTSKDERLKQMEAYLRENPDALSMSRRDDPDKQDPEPPETSVRTG